MVTKAQPEKRRMGRPSKFTPEARARIIEALRAGNYRHIAAAYAGIGERTFNTWMASTAPDYLQFQREVMEAETFAHVTMVARVMKAAQRDAKHAQWWLERKFHDLWGRKDRIETRQVDKDGNDAPVSGVLIAPAPVTPEEWDRLYGPNAGGTAS